MELLKVCLEKEVNELEKKVGRKPEGTLTYITCNGSYQYYVQTRSNGKRSRKYLKDERVQEKLAAKRLEMILLRDAQNELESVNAYLKKRKIYSTDQLYERDALRALILRSFEKWETADYSKNPYHPNGLIMEGANGVMVASKSEKDITYGLLEAELPNRYEQEFRFEGRKIYPDFTIFHPLTGKTYIWEHFGKMDDEDYAKNAYEKIELYKRNKFFPGDKLILTFEDQDHPLTNRKIYAIIQYYFGDWLKSRGIDFRDLSRVAS